MLVAVATCPRARALSTVDTALYTGDTGVGHSLAPGPVIGRLGQRVYPTWGRPKSQSRLRSTQLTASLLVVPLSLSSSGCSLLSVSFRPGSTRWSPVHFSREKKVDYLKRAHIAAVRNIEMESTVFAAMCRLCGLKGKFFMNA